MKLKNPMKKRLDLVYDEVMYDLDFLEGASCLQLEVPVPLVEPQVPMTCHY